MKKSILLFTGIIGFSILINITWPHELTPEIEAIMDAIIQAHEAETTSFRQGTGIATVSIIRGPVGKEKTEENKHAQFWFKGRLRRTDFYSIGSETTKSLLQVRVDNGEFFYSYSPSLNAASVEPSGRPGFKGNLLQDFHPDVFLNFISDIPLSQTIRRMKDGKDKNVFKFDPQFTEEGFLKFTGTSNEKVKYGSQVMDMIANFSFLLDPKHSYRILSYHLDQKNFNGPDSSNVDDMKVEWNDYGSEEAYPKSIKSHHMLVRSSDVLKHPPEGVKELDREVETHIEISVKEFQSDINIEDSIFTLKGMGVKYGTKVNDQVSGIFYTYGGDKVSEASLESLLSDSQTTKQPSSKSVVHSKAQETRLPGSDANNSSSKNIVTPNNVTLGTTNRTRCIIIASIMVIIISGAFLLLRLVVRKRQEN
ncbi:MAG: hypothetical protein NT055_02180 [Nitrospirae bacterium]|nr:hypothetical protein [Nitrospirota bacterium]